MTPAPAPVIWVVYAPDGQWSTGPVVVTDPTIADSYRRMAWRVHGPYIYNGAPA